ncbi:LacI family DNA-binding transcriptional regulator [Nordella sp. HKS 07]|uniref:LacI family DNA-binding transcriptional regulator n=1 Tax=Nordella sp. HKS 07 TaxID=2712222 RepID=UPI0013E1E9E5|nr:LacI family DNA-binding transcriptional regulator [Nordella sp. HKS 07]QIG47760.1 LacI family DNA-binding transcriptional regulator [Nordella sp. HKS 07]
MAKGDGGSKRGFGPTMAEVAALASVTKMTVSRVLRQPEKVNPETRKRVSSAMLKLGYVPNRLAGSLTSGATGLIAAIVPTLRHSIFADVLEGLSDVISEAGLDLFVSFSSYRTDVEESQIRSILERRPDALMLTGLTHSKASRDILRNFGIPVIETWETAEEPIDMMVGYSNRDAAHAMTGELVRAGYRRIAFVNGSSAGNERARLRAEGYLAALQEAGLPALPIHVVEHDADIRPEIGARALIAVRQQTPDVDAIFFTSDIFAVGAILACREQGIDVPNTIGIAGFHDLEIGRVVSPTLTTVHVPATEMGRKAGHMLLARLSGGRSNISRQNLGFSIILRESARRSRG